MEMNRLTQKSREAMHDAQTKALRFGHSQIDPVYGATIRVAVDNGEIVIAHQKPTEAAA